MNDATTPNRPSPPRAASRQLRNGSIVGCGPRLRNGGDSGPPLRQQVFEHVRAEGQATRSQITRSLGISGGMVTQLTADLIRSGLLEEMADTDRQTSRETARGRPPTALGVVPESGRVLGLKLSEDVHTAVITDFAGVEHGSATRPSGRRPSGLDALSEEVAALVDQALSNAAGPSTVPLVAIGLGLPGLVKHEEGTVAWSPLLSQRNAPLKAALEARLGLPVHVDNDVNMLSLAELWFGAGRWKSDFAVVTIEQGVGMGLVLGNQLYRGARGMGLELGHTKVQMDGALCRCGRRGCLEAYVADYALLREAATALDSDGLGPVAPEDMLDRLFGQAKAGNRAAATIFRRAGRYLSLGLSNVVQLFDPELIILSGARMRYDYLYAEEVLAEMTAQALDDQRPPVRVEIHAWGDLVWARGATALALSVETDRLLGDPALA
ncbi:ROK family protein [Marivita sp.]|uniref:ROK family protein n=1 Tax=Marivita sp. TaxID=2003365 RepID=UPI0025C4003E|nr:ROK family protein [Marivita sp.]